MVVKRFTFDNPLRRRIQDPDLIYGDWCSRDRLYWMSDVVWAIFSPPLARLVGQEGTVICVDMQAQMLEAARRKAEKAGLDGVMRFQKCTENSLGLTVAVDFALAFWMVHEVADQRKFLAQIWESLKQPGTLLIAEPKLHVAKAGFDKTVSTALEEGFAIVAEPGYP